MRRLTYFINHALQLHVLFVDGTRIAVKTHMHHGRYVVAADHHVLDIVLQLRAEQHRLPEERIQFRVTYSRPPPYWKGQGRSTPYLSFEFRELARVCLHFRESLEGRRRQQRRQGRRETVALAGQPLAIARPSGVKVSHTATRDSSLTHAHAPDGQ